MYQNRYKDIRTTLNNKARDAQTDLDSLRCLRALKTSKLETGAEGRNSEDNKREGKTPGQALLHTD
jgi:hypothetical protein